MESAKGSENGNQESEYEKANENGEQGIESANEKGEQGTESANENGEQVTESAPNPSPHTLDLDQPKKPGLYKCKGCNQFGANKRYKCRSCDNLTLHEVCAKIYVRFKDHEVRGEILDAHILEDFKFRHKTRRFRRCDACKKFLKGFVLESWSPKSRFHPLCATLPEQFTHRGHEEHPVTLMKDTSEKYTCSHCGNPYSGWKYRCTQTTCSVTYCLNCSMNSIHEFGNIVVAPPSRLERILGPVFYGCKTLTGWVMRGFFERLGGTAGVAASAAIVALCGSSSCCNNNEGGGEEETGEQEEEDHDENGEQEEDDVENGEQEEVDPKEQGGGDKVN